MQIEQPNACLFSAYKCRLFLYSSEEEKWKGIGLEVFVLNFGRNKQPGLQHWMSFPVNPSEVTLKMFLAVCFTPSFL